jgi:hypothetical protein
MGDVDGQTGALDGPVAEPLLLGADGRPVALADTVDCKVELRRLFMAESLRLSQGKPPVDGGCPGACPTP